MSFPQSSDDLWSLIESNDPEELKRRGGVHQLIHDLKTDPKNGIASNTISQRITKYGSNELPDREIPSFYSMLLAALSDETIIILIACAVVSLVLEFFFASPEELSTSWIDGTAILAAVAIVSFVQAYSNHKQEEQFAAVNRIKAIFDVTVVRNGQIQRIKNIDVVVGDIVHIEPGDSIPADAILIQSDGLHMEQSVQTGEADAVFKSEDDPFIISNTLVREGRGTILIVCVGLKSNVGHIYDLINSEVTQTPLQAKLEVLAEQIGKMGIYAASLIFLVLCIGWVIRTTKAGWTWGALREPMNYFIVSLTIVACAVPEGLPLAVTISLAYSMRQMMTDNNFVRHLSACETMGSATVICTDKTGTLTTNQMTVEHITIGSTVMNPTDVATPIMSIFAQSVSANSHAVIGTDNIGSQTECALLRCLSNNGYNWQILRNDSQILKTFEFDQIRKRMSTVINDNGRLVIHTKGAPDSVLPACTSYLNSQNQKVPLDENTRRLISEITEKECKYAYRTIAVAYGDASSLDNHEEAEQNLTLIGIASIRDSLRPSVVSAISDCQRAGIRVIMVTGDHVHTAEAIAHECKILNGSKVIITGAQLRAMDQAELDVTLPRIAVVARSTPMDKHLLVKQLQQAGEIVGVTGDGTNDVAALMAADVGMAMNISGTELAKEASDIVIMDDNFKSIVRAVIWGRTVFNNIKRFLTFQLTASVVTLFVEFLSACILRETPFKAVQLLWVNLIMDSFGALALSTGKPHDYLLQRPPQNKSAPLISRFMIQNIVGQAILQICLFVAILIYPANMEAYTQHHYTFLFTVFVYCQMFNLVNARAAERGDDPLVGMCDTPIFFGIILLIAFIQFALVQFAGPYCSCTPMSLVEWGVATTLAAITLPVGALVRKVRVSEVSEAGSYESNFSTGSPEDIVPLLSQSEV